MACTVDTNRHKRFLRYKLYWNGMESTEGTKLKDTPQNRKRLEARAQLISEEMEAGTFDYLKWFPNGNKADHFRPTVNKQLETKPLTIKHFTRLG
jgi:hypothetical protein